MILSTAFAESVLKFSMLEKEFWCVESIVYFSLPLKFFIVSPGFVELSNSVLKSDYIFDFKACPLNSCNSCFIVLKASRFSAEGL